MGSLERKLRRQRKKELKREVKKMETGQLKLVYDIRWSGDRDEQNNLLRMERRNDPKYLVAMLNGLDTNKDPFYEYRRTITRVYDKLVDLIRDWSKKVDDFLENNRENADAPDFCLEAEIEVSAEGMRMLKKITEKDQPSDPWSEGKYRSIPVQSLLVSLEDQHDEWYKSQGGKEPANDKNPGLSPTPTE